MELDLYVHKGAVRTLIDSLISKHTTPDSYAGNKALKLLKEQINLMPTLTKEDVTNTADLLWWEEWSPATSECPRECTAAGWECSNCGIDLGDYMTEHGGEHCYFDRFEEKPTIAFCPCCGRKFNK
jgi:hypothetical protein